jgi:hypothetical protein
VADGRDDLQRLRASAELGRAEVKVGALRKRDREREAAVAPPALSRRKSSRAPAPSSTSISRAWSFGASITIAWAAASPGATAIRSGATARRVRARQSA